MSIGLILTAGGYAPAAHAQQLAAAAPTAAPLPKTAAAGAAQGGSTADPANNGALYGTVTDPNGGLVAGANVKLSGPVSRVATSDSNGEFSFTHLPAGDYSLNVTGPGMQPSKVPNVALRPGGVRFLPPVVLAVAAATTDVTVYANQEALAEEQLQLQLHQKVMGFLPNYYSSYDWNAVHLWPKQKLELGYRTDIDPVTFFIIAGEAGVDQYFHRYPGYGTGPQAYAKIYGADYATEFAGSMIGDVALPVLFHQDPRYFYKGTGSFSSRAVYAISRTFIVRGDNKHPEFAYSRVLGDLAAGGIANTYYPDSNRGVGLVFTSAAVDLAANASTNLIREFILPGLTSHVPKKVRENSPIHF